MLIRRGLHKSQISAARARSSLVKYLTAEILIRRIRRAEIFSNWQRFLWQLILTDAEYSLESTERTK